MPIDNVFLTDNRRLYLDGEYEGSESASYTIKSRLKRRSEITLHELIEVANSPEIDNSDVFDPDDVAMFLWALMTDSAQQDTVGLVQPTESDGYSDELAAYRRNIIGAVSPLIVNELLQQSDVDLNQDE